MSVVGKIAKAGLGIVGRAILGGISKPKQAAPKTQAYMPQAIDARRSSLLADELSRRAGSAANRRTGDGGAESTTTGKKRLMGT